MTDRMPQLPAELQAELAAVLAAWAQGQDPWRDFPRTVRLDDEAAAAYRGRKILVTGGGGFIGGALARVLAGLGAEVLALDKDEAGLVRLQDAARADSGQPPVLALADCRIADRMSTILAAFPPAIVFHCAAHKYLPLLESQAQEAWANNCAAVVQLGRQLGSCGTEAFVLVSTDKAVEPCSQLGASKQGAEHALQSEGAQWARRAVTVRLANVLASGGSVVERYWRAMRQGLPLEVRHPAMERYFLTLPQAVALLLAAGAGAAAGELWAPRLEAPVPIQGLAAAMQALGRGLGLPPPPEPPVQITAPRPGEKLSERLLSASEAARAQPLAAAGLPIWRLPPA